MTLCASCPFLSFLLLFSIPSLFFFVFFHITFAFLLSFSHSLSLSLSLSVLSLALVPRSLFCLFLLSSVAFFLCLSAIPTLSPYTTTTHTESAHMCADLWLVQRVCVSLRVCAHVKVRVVWKERQREKKNVCVRRARWTSEVGRRKVTLYLTAEIQLNILHWTAG